MAFNTVYDFVTNREDLTKDLVLKGAHQTPLFSALKLARTKPVTNIKHEWSDYTLAAGADNAQLQNFTPTTTSTVPVRRYNYIQIFQKAFGIANTQLQGMQTAGINDLYKWTADARFTELGKDIEYALINSTASVSGSAGTASRLAGMFAATTTNTVAPSATTSVFTEDEFVELVRKCFDQTGTGSDLQAHTGSLNIKRITNFSGLGKTQFVDEETKVHNRLVNYVVTNFGTIKLVPNLNVGNSTIGLFNMDTWALAIKRPPELIALPSSTDGKSAYWVMEMTVEFLNETANAKMTGIATA